MIWLFNLGYLLALLAAAPWLLWRWLVRGKPLAGSWTKLSGNVAVSGDRPRIWLHAVSVGEVNLLAIMLPALQRHWPDHDFVVSTTTATGGQVARQKFAGRATVVWFPWDFSWAVRRAVQRIQPALIILGELELWPNFLRIAGAQTPLAVINGRLTERSAAGYRRWRWLVGDAWQAVRLVAAQNDTYAARFRDLGIPAERVHVCGNVKFDGAVFDRDNPRTARLASWLRLEPGCVIWLAGSTQAPEEAAIVAAYVRLRQEFPHLRLILAPRHPERGASVADVLRAAELRPSRRSQWTEPVLLEATTVPLLDTVGELAGWWGLAHIAFVGGSLGNRGGQNMIEPAAFAAAVCFGPNTQNFRDVVALLDQADAATVVANADHLEQFVRRCLREPAWAAEQGARAAAVVRSQAGATQATLERLATLLPPSAAAWRAAS